LLPSLRIATRALILAAQVEIAETGEFNLLARRERCTQLFEKHVHQLARLALVEPELVEQCFRDLGLGQCHVYLSRIVALNSRSRSATTRATTASVSSSVSVREISCKFNPIARLLRPEAIPPPRWIAKSNRSVNSVPALVRTWSRTAWTVVRPSTTTARSRRTAGNRDCSRCCG